MYVTRISRYIWNVLTMDKGALLCVCFFSSLSSCKKGQIVFSEHKEDQLFTPTKVILVLNGALHHEHLGRSGCVYCML
jgi:hypothetical protein